MTGAHYPFLDLARFGAALLVTFGHVRSLYFDSITKVQDAGIATKAFYLVTSLQHEAVVLFFVISGFFVGGAAHRSLSEKRFRLVPYLAARFSRIYIVFVPALLLGGALTLGGLSTFPDTRFYSERPLFPSNFDPAWSWSDIPCHVACLQGLICKGTSFNPPLWSIGYEWPLYLMAPLLIGVWFLPIKLIWRVASMVVTLALILYVVGGHRWNLLMWGSFWYAGMASAWLSRTAPVSGWVGTGALGICATTFIVSRVGVVPAMATDFAIALAFAAALTSPAVLSISKIPRTMKAAADFSFSLYAIHLPLAVFVGASLESAGWPGRLSAPGLATYSAFAITVSASLIGAYLFAGMTEAHTQSFRQWLLKLSPTQREQSHSQPAQPSSAH
jgi:peptidoglycan/LPS O-acetylase OafA/YrhL